MKTPLNQATANTDVSKGVAEVITLNSDMQNTQQSAKTIAHEAFVHADKDADKLNTIDQSENKSTDDIKNVDPGDGGKADHCDLGTNGNESYKGSMDELDKQDNTNYYSNEYKDDKKKRKR